MSRSYANLLDLSGETPLFTKPLARRGMTRSMTVTSLVSEARELEHEDSVTSDAPSSISQERLIVVSNMLPINAKKGEEKGVGIILKIG